MKIRQWRLMKINNNLMRNSMHNFGRSSVMKARNQRQSNRSQNPSNRANNQKNRMRTANLRWKLRVNLRRARNQMRKRSLNESRRPKKLNK